MAKKGSRSKVNRDKAKNDKPAYVKGAPDLRIARSTMQPMKTLFRKVGDVMLTTRKPLKYPTEKNAVKRHRKNVKAKTSVARKQKMSAVSNAVKLQIQLRDLKTAGLHPQARAEVMHNGSVLVTSSNGRTLVFPKITVSLKPMTVADVNEYKESLRIHASQKLQTEQSLKEPQETEQSKEPQDDQLQKEPQIQQDSTETTAPVASQTQKKRFTKVPKKRLTNTQPDVVEDKTKKQKIVKVPKETIPEVPRRHSHTENKRIQKSDQAFNRARKIPPKPHHESRFDYHVKPKWSKTLSERRPRLRQESPPHNIQTKENNSFIRSLYSNELSQGKYPSLIPSGSAIIPILKYARIPKLSNPRSPPTWIQTPSCRQSALERTVPKRFETYRNNYTDNMVARRRDDFQSKPTFAEPKKLANGMRMDEQDWKAPPSTDNIGLEATTTMTSSILDEDLVETESESESSEDETANLNTSVEENLIFGKEPNSKAIALPTEKKAVGTTAAPPQPASPAVEGQEDDNSDTEDILDLHPSYDDDIDEFLMGIH